MTKIIIDKTEILYFCIPAINLVIYCRSNGYVGVLKKHYLIQQTNILNNFIINKTYT